MIPPTSAVIEKSNIFLRNLYGVQNSHRVSSFCLTVGVKIEHAIVVGRNFCDDMLYFSIKERGAIVSETTELNAELQKKMLVIARETLESYVRRRSVPDFSVEEPELLENAGAFVTLKAHGRLRGCIGYVEGIKPLYQTIIDMAIAASTEDPRFTPVKEHELQDLEIEISVMTPLRRIERPEEVKVGVHGILMKRGFRSGLLLPQVATEHNWERQTFLEHTCLKAGLQKDAWKDPETEIYVFSAQVFHEV